MRLLNTINLPGWLILYLAVMIAGLWIALIYWTVSDIRKRSRAWVALLFSCLLVLIFFVPGLLIYLSIRPRQTLDEIFISSVKEELLFKEIGSEKHCTQCDQVLQDDWKVCVTCHKQVRKDCLKCGKLIDLDWELCPYCGNENLIKFDDLAIAKNKK